jgi:hypothetical protein
MQKLVDLKTDLTNKRNNLERMGVLEGLDPKDMPIAIYNYVIQHLEEMIDEHEKV